MDWRRQKLRVSQRNSSAMVVGIVVFENDAYTDRCLLDIVILACAIGARGLPMLYVFAIGRMTAWKIGAIVDTVLKGYLRVKSVQLTGSCFDGDDAREVVGGMF